MKKVKITHDWWDATLEIQESPETLEAMKEQLLFWMSGEDMIEAAGGDIEKAYLKMLAVELIHTSIEWNIEGVKSQFEEKEGWAPLDGTKGVTLIRIDSWEFSEDDFFICEVED